ncbi:MAG: hypothetical protein HOD60_14550 [Candidatus Nitrosopelagicus sp.]|jgi:hypothetical protein|nr:hypothetical protein [Candidatus Nitrosopelagicus sp.]
MTWIFFNKIGKAIWYTNRRNDVFSFNGISVGYIQNDSIYAYFGAHLAWFVDGWIINHNGEALFFTKNAVGGPGRPALQSIPNKLASQIPPNKRSRATPPSYPPERNSWGNTNYLLQI